MTTVIAGSSRSAGRVLYSGKWLITADPAPISPSWTQSIMAETAAAARPTSDAGQRRAATIHAKYPSPSVASFEPTSPRAFSSMPSGARMPVGAGGAIATVSAGSGRAVSGVRLTGR